MVKRILAIFIIMILVITPVSARAAGVGSVVVAGGTIATGGIGSGAVASTAITVATALLFSLGVTVKLTSEAISAGRTAYDFVRDKFAQWVGGTSAEDMTDSQREELKKRFQVINGGGGSGADPDQQQDNGINIGPNGNIYLSAKSLEMLKKFINWLDSTGQLKDNEGDSTNIGQYGTFYGTQYYVHNQGVKGFEVGSSRQIPKSINIAIIKTSATGNYKFCIFDTTEFEYAMDKGSTTTYGTASKLDGTDFYRYYVGNYQMNLDIAHYPSPELFDISTLGYYGSSGFDNYLRNLTPSDAPASEDGFYKGENYDSNALDNPDNNQTIINPGLIPTIADNNPGKDYQVSVDDYMEALRQLLNQKTNPADVPAQLPVTDVPTGVTVPVDIPADQPAEWPITTPSSPTATPDVPTGSTPVVNPVSPAVPETAMPKLTFPLDEYFPFCIPFDVYALLNKFSAEPVTPVFDVGFTEPFTNSEVNLHIDLTPWNGVATAIRTAELGAFIVGLALLSKQIFTRG